MVPVIVGSYLPASVCDKTDHELFDLILNNILTGNASLDDSTKTLLFDGMMAHCTNEDHYAMVLTWFEKSKVINGAGAPLEHIELTLKNKHALVKRIWSSKSIALGKKEEVLAELNKLDKGDWFDETSKFCEAAHPENKAKMWAFYFNQEKGSEVEKWGLHTFQHSFRGWYQGGHAEFIQPFEDEFFSKIGQVIKTKGRSVAESYYHGLQPMIKTDALSIKKFEDVLAKVQTEDKDNTFFINELKDSITILNTRQKGQKLSQDYIDQNKK